MAIAVVLFFCMGMGPSLKVWRLTGKHRIVDSGQRGACIKVG
jgi:hypothetical protein